MAWTRYVDPPVDPARTITRGFAGGITLAGSTGAGAGQILCLLAVSRRCWKVDRGMPRKLAAAICVPNLLNAATASSARSFGSGAVPT